MTARRRGMDHAHYSFAPLPDRPRITWPDRAHIACVVFLYLEHWELAPPAGWRSDPRFRDTFGGFFPDYRTYTWREYGNRVGIFRILDVLDRYPVKVTVAAGSSACERYPFLVEELRRRGHEFAAHGTHANRLLTSAMSAEEERAFIAEAVDSVTAATGARPVGWIGQDRSESARTPLLLAEAGLNYVADWPNDDQPYLLNPARDLVSIPSQAEWDDVELLWHRRVLSPKFPRIVDGAFSRLHEEGATSGRFFGLHVHPWLLGMPHRTRYFEEALGHVCARPRVWHATAREVADHIRNGGTAAA